MKENPLGKPVPYPEQYDPGLLVPLPRAENRARLGIDGEALPFCGADIWNAYELSWLNLEGLPQVARARFIVPCTSPALIESKSLKLYLTSLNQQRYAEPEVLRQVLETDLSVAAGARVTVLVQPFRGMQEILEAPGGVCLDSLAPVCDRYHPDADLLQVADADSPFAELADEVLFTDLFRSRCPQTGQPDWATVTVCYRGVRIDPVGLLRYLVSFRLHQDYHENCVERIYCDIRARCRPHSLSVEANFLRRGGLDINPVRASEEMMDYLLFPRYNRQ